MVFNEIIQVIHNWFEHLQKEEYASNMRIEVVKDEADCFHVFFETLNYISELMVHEPYFAPYRWVSFQVMSVKKPVSSSPVFTYYDSSSDTTEEMICQLNKGIKITICS